MAISINCSSCGKHYQAADHMAGRRVRCKNCGNTFQLLADGADASQPYRPPGDTGVVPSPNGTVSGTISGSALAMDPMAPPSRRAQMCGLGR